MKPSDNQTPTVAPDAPKKSVGPIKNYITQIPMFEFENVKGDTAVVQTRVKAMGFDVGPIDDDFGPLTKAGVSAFQKSVGLIGTGVIGDRTLAYLNIEIKGMTEAEPVDALAAACKKIYDTAVSQLGVSEAQNPSQVIEYHKTTSLEKKYWSIYTSWCASFWNWVIGKAGFTGNRSAWARDGLSWGVKLTKEILGCTMVFERNAAGGDSHITIYAGKTKVEGGVKFYYCIGGNQSNKVGYGWYSEKVLLGMRAPKIA